jgi:hypothetical protein
VGVSFSRGKTPLAAAIVLVLVSAFARAEDFSPIDGAARVVSRVSYLSWDNAKGWVELEDRKTVIEDFGADRKIHSREVRYGSTTLEMTTFIYSTEGVQKLTVDGGDALVRKAAVKNVDDRTIEQTYAADGTLLFTSVIRTDAAGRVIENERRDATGVLLYRVRFLYDAKGNLLEAASLNPDGSTAFVSTFTYSDHDFWGAWRTRRENCTFADVKNRPKEIVRRSISAGGAD